MCRCIAGTHKLIERIYDYTTSTPTLLVLTVDNSVTSNLSLYVTDHTTDSPARVGPVKLILNNIVHDKLLLVYTHVQSLPIALACNRELR